MMPGPIHHSWRVFGRRSRSATVLTLSTAMVAGVLAAPAMAAAPTLSGTPRQGQQLTVTPDPMDMNAPPAPVPPADITWMSCSGASCTQVASGATYTLTAGDVGNTIRAQEAETTGTLSSTPTAVVFPILFAAIGGPPTEGQTLQAFTDWSVKPPPAGTGALSFVWSRCNPGCVTAPGVTGNQYTLSGADVGGTIRVVVSETDPSGPQSNSAQSGTITAAPVTAPTQSSPTSVTTVGASPTSATTNQVVTLIATVTAIASGRSPIGTVAFADRGATIGGCGSVPVSGPGQSVTVTCTATFAAASSPEPLTAAFTRATGSSVTGSSSAPASLTIRRDSSNSSVDVSNPTVALGHTATYTASIQGSLTGSVKPSGTVEFLDQGKPIAACTTSPLATTTVGSQASCVVRYQRSGSHSITVAYAGDTNFTGSGSPSATHVTVRPISGGTVNSTMQWSFHFTRSYTRVIALLIDSVSAGTSVIVKCRGKGCPFAKRSTMVHRSTRCPAKGKGKAKAKAKCVTQRSRSLNLESAFRGRRLRGGARVTIFLMRPQWVGKYYQFAIRTSGAPRIRIACLAPGSTAPGVGC
jgi:Bacterial Ig-like domain (group 3)